VRTSTDAAQGESTRADPAKIAGTRPRTPLLRSAAKLLCRAGAFSATTRFLPALSIAEQQPEGGERHEDKGGDALKRGRHGGRRSWRNREMPGFSCYANNQGRGPFGRRRNTRPTPCQSYRRSEKVASATSWSRASRWRQCSCIAGQKHSRSSARGKRAG